jgi:hypothetical protein
MEVKCTLECQVCGKQFEITVGENVRIEELEGFICGGCNTEKIFDDPGIESERCVE